MSVRLLRALVRGAAAVAAATMLTFTGTVPLASAAPITPVDPSLKGVLYIHTSFESSDNAVDTTVPTSAEALSSPWSGCPNSTSQ